jgi:hypothetical protein
LYRNLTIESQIFGIVHQWACAYLTECTPLKLELIVMLLHHFCNGEKEALVHVESPVKVLLRIGGTLDEVILHDLGVALSSIPVDVCAAEL